MSSYHIINAVIVGIFPMLIVSILIGFVCYLLCCINQIKAKFKEYRQKRDYNRVRRHLLKKYNIENMPQDQIVVDQQPANSSRSIDKNNNTNSYNYFSKDEIINNQIKLYHYESDINKPFVSTPIHVEHQKNSLPIKNETKFNLPILNESSHKNVESIMKQTKDLTPSRTSLKLDLIKKNDPSTSNQTYSNCKTVIDNHQLLQSARKHDSFVIIELDESPKGVFTRMQHLALYAKDKNSNSISPAIDCKIQNLAQPPYKSKKLTHDFYNEDEEDIEDYNDDDDDTECNSVASLSSSNDKQLQPNDNVKIKTNKKKIPAITSNNNNNIKRMRKKLPTSNHNHHNSSESQNESAINKRPKILTLSRNRLESDVELMEDDILFHDDNDSLSSAGICELTGGSGLGRIASQNTLIFNSKDINNSNFNQSTPTSISNINNQFLLSNTTNNNTSSTSPHVKDQTYFKKQFRSNLINASSMSDIDPDENILKNLLIKNKTNNYNNSNNNK